MKEFQKGILDNERVISAENVQRMGEVIALCCIKTVIARSGKDLHKLYADLLHDINRAKDDYSPFSSAYDLAQEAMLFLCRHMGKRLDDVYVTKTGRKTTIKQACFRYTDRYLDKQYTRHMANTVNLDEKIATKLETTPADEQKNDYTVVDGLISKMKLTTAEYETLCAYMAGLTYLEVTRLLNVNRTTIWRRQKSIQKKYLYATNSF